MKKLFLSIAVVLAAVTVKAQDLTPLPVDENVKYGVLDNGLTYIVRHNAETKNRADFYIAQKVGSVLEDENQRGLAHFLEHMAFNGSQHFPGKNMINYLERIGVKFGNDLNAYTSFDQTVYNISNVPTDRDNAVDSCLYILYDWSSAISLEEKEIDNERGVIHEEWRTRNTAPLRLYEATANVLFKGSKYPNRMPIGTMDVILNFSYDTLRDYYKKWYRPDLQGIIIVGDVDADAVVEKIKEIWSARKLDENRAERVWEVIPDNDEPLISIATDKEANNTAVDIYCKYTSMDNATKATVKGVEDAYIKAVVSDIFTNRLTDLCKNPNSPLIDAKCIEGKMVGKSDAFMVNSYVKEGQSGNAIKVLETEIERLKRYGVTEGEYERAKANIIALYEREYNERHKVSNSKYIKEYVNYFLGGGSISGIEREFAEIKGITQRITTAEINEHLKAVIGNKNRVYAVEGIAKEGVAYPTEAEVLQIIKDVDNSEIEAYIDDMTGKQLISEDIIPGKVVKEKYNKEFDAKVWTLSNGVKVVLKNNAYKKDQLMIFGTSKGGAYLYGEKDLYNTLLFDDIISLSRVGGFTRTQIGKLLAGKMANSGIMLSNRSEAVRGVTSQKDVETFLQLTYLLMTDISRDDEAYAAWIEGSKEALKNIDANPKNAVSDSLAIAIFNGNPRQLSIKAADLEKIDYDRILEIWRERYSNAADFTFNIVGNIDEELLRPLVEKYLGSLPSSKKREKSGKDKYGMRHSDYVNVFERKMENAVGNVNCGFIGKMECSTKNMMMLSIFEQIMDMVYTSTIREEEGGTYGVGTKIVATRENDWLFRFSFDTNVESMERLKERAVKEMYNIIENGTPQEKFDKVKKYMVKKAGDEMKRNTFWLNELNSEAIYGDADGYNYLNILEGITIEEYEKFVKKIFKKTNKFEVMMKGVAEQ